MRTQKFKLYTLCLMTSLLVTIQVVNNVASATPAKLSISRQAPVLRGTSYYDGTTLLLVNWSHQAFDVEIPGFLPTRVTLYPVDTDDNILYIHSSMYCDLAKVYIYQVGSPYIVDYLDMENQSTLEIRDGDDYNILFAKSQDKTWQFTVKKGLY